MRRLTALLPLLLLAVLALASPASARPLVGIGDQNLQMFDDPRFQKLDVELTRLTLPWDWYRDAAYIQHLDQWVAATQRARVRPLIAFNRNWRPGGERFRPPLKLYLKSFRLFRERYPHIRDFSAWNEENHPSQPTFKHPKTAARYYKAMVRACPKCTVVAADVLDSNDMPRWIAKFKRYAPKARLWGLHAYKDANNGTTRHTRALLKLVKGRIWLTETGGIKRLKPHPGSKGNGRTTSLSGQARAIKRVYGLAKLSKRIRRIYFYQWKQAPKQRWDSALVDARGHARPALAAVRWGLKKRR